MSRSEDAFITMANADFLYYAQELELLEDGRKERQRGSGREGGGGRRQQAGGKHRQGESAKGKEEGGGLHWPAEG